VNRQLNIPVALHARKSSPAATEQEAGWDSGLFWRTFRFYSLWPGCYTEWPTAQISAMNSKPKFPGLK